MTTPIIMSAIGFRLLCEKRAVQGQALCAPDGGAFVTLHFSQTESIPTGDGRVTIPSGGVALTDMGELLARTGGRL